VPGKIFISYRRDDVPGDARGVRDALAAEFGKSSIFMDVDNLLAGQRFDEELAKALAACDVLVAIIGPRWMDLLKGKGASGERDYVREEIAQALKRRIVVIPVRVGREGQMPPLPRSEELPDDIRDLMLYQKHDVAHERFGRDMAELIDAIRVVRKSAAGVVALPDVRPAALGWIAAVAVGAAAVAWVAAHQAGVAVPWSWSLREDDASRAEGCSGSDRDHDRRVQACTRTIERGQNLVAGYHNRGIAYHYKGEYDRAIADYEQALRLEPGRADIYHDRGLAYHKKGEYDPAITNYGQAILLKPDLAQAYYLRGNAYKAKGEYDRAIADLGQAIRLKPDYVVAYNDRGAAYAEKGQYDQAIADYDQALRLKPDYAVAYVNRDNAYRRKGQ
jgi:tetratricopeptide (TPR) repeat protein